MSEVLEEIFGATDEDVESFSEFVEKSASTQSLTDNQVVRIRSTASFVTETQKKITIEHGNHASHYVWHISPHDERRGWGADMKRVVYSVAKVLKKYIPDDVIVDIHLPDTRNNVNVLTIRANDVLESWAVTQEELSKVTGQFFEVLNVI